MQNNDWFLQNELSYDKSIVEHNQFGSLNECHSSTSSPVAGMRSSSTSTAQDRLAQLDCNRASMGAALHSNTCQGGRMVKGGGKRQLVVWNSVQSVAMLKNELNEQKYRPTASVGNQRDPQVG